MNMKQLQKMMKQAQSMQSQLEEELSEMEVEGTSGGGVVTVTLDGKKNLKSIRLKKDVVDPDDVEMLEDLILAAVTDAGKKVDELLSNRLGAMSSGLLGGL